MAGEDGPMDQQKQGEFVIQSRSHTSLSLILIFIFFFLFEVYKLWPLHLRIWIKALRNSFDLVSYLLKVANSQGVVGVCIPHIISIKAQVATSAYRVQP
jgi:hypothetical protein